MDLDKLFGNVQKHLRHFKVKCTLVKYSPASDSAIRKAETKLGLTLPKQLRELYLGYSNGVLFQWSNKDAHGFFNLPSVEDLPEQYAGWKQLVLWMDKYEFAHVENPKLAHKTYNGMKCWLPLFAESNGDGFCVVVGRGSNPIVFHRHDWYDGGTGENGHTVAANLQAFFTAWGKVCFTSPKSLYWPAAFVERGVDWTSERFDEKYIVPG